MAKKVLIISTSLRGGSNSEILAKECEKGALAAGHDVELLTLKGKDIKFCIGCLSCQSKGTCVLKDDVAEIMEKVLAAKVIVYATPIYYYEMSGQMKTLLSPMELRCIEGVILGMNYPEIAEKLSISVKSVDNAVTRARSKLKGILLRL